MDRRARARARAGRALEFDSALEHGCRSVAVPAISCGIFGYPLEEAARVALSASLAPEFRDLDITFYLFDQAIHDIWSSVLRQP